MRHLVALATLSLFAALPIASSAQAPTAAPPAVSAGAIRAGTYDLQVVTGGGTLDGTLVLTAKGDSLTVAMHVGEHEPPIKSLTRNGTRLVVNAGVPGMQVVYDFNFDGDAINGTFTFNGDPGIVTGKMRKGAGR